MRLFTCPVCSQLLYFENTNCERCGHRLGYVADRFALTALEDDGDAWREASAADQPTRWRFCANAQWQACNWLVPAGGDAYCAACRHNHIVPDLTFAENLPRWQALEAAKHRLFYTLMRFGLPLATRIEDPVHGLAFNFLADVQIGEKIMTGHENGLITIALREGDDTERNRLRVQLGELYRTPLGHFRHEIGHHYWDLLVQGNLGRNGPQLDAFRAIFGDETADYDQALAAHYSRVDDGSWRPNFVSLYASSHPWEDFAETWAHYLHIVDTLEMARAFGVAVAPRPVHDTSLETTLDFDPYSAADIERIVDAWLPLSFALNSLNRTMGQADAYPFLLPPAVVVKLGFIHGLIGRPALANPALAKILEPQ